MKSKIKIPTLILISFSAGWITYFLHEVFHWFAYSFLNIETSFRVNTIELFQKEQFISDHKILMIYGSGVCFTFLQTVCCYILLKKNKFFWLYIFLIAAFELRFIAAILNFFSPSDEGKISLILGLPLHSVSLIVVGGIGWLVYKSRKNITFSKKQILIVLGAVFVSIYMFSLINI